MNEHPQAHFICPSCTRSERCEILSGETLYQAKGRLRASMGVNCTRPEQTQHLCPMKAREPANPAR